MNRRQMLAATAGALLAPRTLASQVKPKHVTQVLFQSHEYSFVVDEMQLGMFVQVLKSDKQKQITEGTGWTVQIGKRPMAGPQAGST